MTSPDSIRLNTLRICSVSEVTFYHFKDLDLVVTYIIYRGVLRTQSNIYDGAFLRQ